jgi:hypothetical protein
MGSWLFWWRGYWQKQTVNGAEKAVPVSSPLFGRSLANLDAIGMSQIGGPYGTAQIYWSTFKKDV